jgi:hypothetical protein
VTAFRCARCGEWHEGLPPGFAFTAPDAWSERRWRERLPLASSLAEDQCIIRGRYFLKGNIEIPVVGADDPFVWTAWVELDAERFWRADDLHDTPGREREPAYPGRIANALPGYPSTLGLPVSVRTRERGLRPLVVVDDDVHPLGADQRDGVGAEGVEELVGRLYHAADEAA